MYRQANQNWSQSNERIGDLPSYIYYNGDIINSRTDDLTQNGSVNVATADPAAVYNETRDSPLIKDLHQYYFSIIRATMNGTGRDLPLFIPCIQTGQSNVNLTTYTIALTLQQSWHCSNGIISLNVCPTPTNLIYETETKNTILAPTPVAPLIQQDLTSRYYWVMTYQQMLKLVNATFDTALATLYTATAAQWALLTPDAFPYSTLASFIGFNAVAPRMLYNGEVNPTFTIMADSDCYGERLNPIAFPPYVATPVPTTRPVERIFFDTNMFGLFANFANVYYNRTDIPGFPVNFGATVPEGYAYEIIIPNKFYKNVADYRLPPYTGVAPLGYVPSDKQKVYWIAEQDFKSCDSLWSPIASIVFSTTLIPVRNEFQGAGNVLGVGNLGNSTATVPSAFQPIITDLTLDTTVGAGSAVWKQYLNYIPAAEYRLSEFGSTGGELRNIDIILFWKCRLDNKLYPLQMFNQSSVSFKLLFRHKSAPGKNA